MRHVSLSPALSLSLHHQCWLSQSWLLLAGLLVTTGGGKYSNLMIVVTLWHHQPPHYAEAAVAVGGLMWLQWWWSCSVMVMLLSSCPGLYWLISGPGYWHTVGAHENTDPNYRKDVLQMSDTLTWPLHTAGAGRAGPHLPGPRHGTVCANWCGPARPWWGECGAGELARSGWPAERHH